MVLGLLRVQTQAVAERGLALPVGERLAGRVEGGGRAGGRVPGRFARLSVRPTRAADRGSALDRLEGGAGRGLLGDGPGAGRGPDPVLAATGTAGLGRGD